VPTKRLNEQIRRNLTKFPDDFGFRLAASEAAALRSQIATSNKGRGGRRYLPFALTEHGVVMAANVLNSPRAVSMSIQVVRAFVRLRKAARYRGSVIRMLRRLEKAVNTRLDRHDSDIERLFEAVESLMGEEERPLRKIGLTP